MKERDKPLFSIGEVVQIFPHWDHEISRAFTGVETVIIQRRFKKMICPDDIERSMWVYETDKYPVNFVLRGKKYKNGCWSELSLRKKHQPGTGFADLIQTLNEPLDVEELECVT